MKHFRKQVVMSHPNTLLLKGQFKNLNYNQNQ